MEIEYFDNALPENEAIWINLAHSIDLLFFMEVRFTLQAKVKQTF